MCGRRLVQVNSFCPFMASPSRWIVYVVGVRAAAGTVRVRCGVHTGRSSVPTATSTATATAAGPP